MEKRTLTAAIRSIALTAGLVALLAGCSAGGGPAPSNSSGAPTPNASVTPQPSSSASAPTAGGTCTPGQLEYALQSRPMDSGAGSFYWNLVLSNTGTTECTLEGTPTVFVLAAGGRAIGGDQGAEAPPGVVDSVVTLSPGASAYALLHLSQAGAYGCPIVPVTQLGIALPGSSEQRAVVTPNQIDGCDDTTTSILRVSPITAEAVSY